MTKFEIVGYDFCPFCQPSIITLKEKGVDFTMTYIEPDEKPDWVNKASPKGVTPFLLVDGKVLFESAIMNEYLNEVTSGDLHPNDAYLKAQNRVWINHSYDLLDHIYELKTTKDQDAFETEKEKLRAKLHAIEEIIGDKPFFNGNEFNLIDGVFAPVFRSIAIFDSHFAAGILDALPNVSKWSVNILKRTSVRESVVENFDDASTNKIGRSNTLMSRRHSKSAV